jgi:hypothetical protein
VIYVQPQQVEFHFRQRQDLALSQDESAGDASDSLTLTPFEGRAFGFFVGLSMVLINCFALAPDIFDGRNVDLILCEFFYLLAIFTTMHHFA